MAYAPHREGHVRDARENKRYYCRLYRPHVLADAINAAYPEQATRYAVNIGAGDGASCNDPVYPLFARGFAGLAVEGGDAPALASNLPADNIRKLTRTFVTPINVSELLRTAECPGDCDFLKIDIDGYDGPVLKAVLESGYRPKIIQMEVNPEFPPPVAFSVLYHPRYRPSDRAGRVGGFYGASAAYVLHVTRLYGYRLAYLDFVTEWTHDVTLVRGDLFEVAVGVFGEDIRTASAREFWLAHPPGYSHFAEYGIDSLAWRYRTDYHELLPEIWDHCLAANATKHEDFVVPFHLSC
jgi:hypothetical protein